jgi:hypothetical protein
MLVGAYLGSKLLQEGHTRQWLVDAVLMVAGILALTPS